MVLKSLSPVGAWFRKLSHVPARRLLTFNAVSPLAGVILLSSCASQPPTNGTVANEPQSAIDRVNDPWEPANRKFFAFGIMLDRNIGQPIARGYRKSLKPDVREAIRNLVNNLREPVTLGNDLLQGNIGKAGLAISRLIVNSTLGIGGLYDPAQEFGLPRHQEDFGQTLAVWGLGEGPYLFVPMLGPYPPRDLFGFAVDIMMNPLFWINTNWAQSLQIGRLVLYNVDMRERTLETVQQLEETSLDYYAAVRNLYRQTRNFSIRDGEPAFEDLPDFDEFE